jgi:DNA relaxase NicK
MPRSKATGAPRAPNTCKIDYYAFTLPLAGALSGAGQGSMDYILKVVDLWTGGILTPILGRQGWQLEHGGKGFTYRMRDKQTEVAFSFGDTNTHVQVEIAGVACSHLRGAGILDSVVRKTTDRATRIDVAVDFECDVDVQKFIGKGYSAAFKSGGYIFSEDGKTAYIGARESERFTRVYRYHEPHPRAKFLRIETVYRKKWARALLADHDPSDVVELARAAHAAFDYKHPLWKQFAPVPATAPTRSYERAGQGTMRWLLKQVTPALLRLHCSGEIDLGEWWETYIAPNIE